MKAELTLIPTISINPSKICLFNELHWEPIRPSRQHTPMPLEYYTNQSDRIINSSRTANGIVSKNARRKMSNALDYLLLMASPKSGQLPKTGKKFQFRIVFITLDLPSKQIHTDNVIKSKCLNSFLIELTRYHNVRNYIWRAEKQKNGNIHFHLIIDKFILYNELRKRWNRIVNKLGYVDRYAENQKEFHKDGFRLRPELTTKWTAKQQYQAYLTGIKSHWTSPNSTDIHSVKFIQNIKSYISKYLTKNEKKKNPTDDKCEDITSQIGRLWGCNTDLSNIKGARLQVDSEISEALTHILKSTKCQVYDTEYFSVYSIDINQLANHSPTILFKYFTQYLKEKFNYSSQLYLG